MYFEHDKLRGRMAERGYNIRMLAKEIGIHENTLSNKLYSNTFFTQYEIVMICKVLGISDAEIPTFFFVHR